MSPRAIYLPVVNYGTSDEYRYWTNKCPIFYNNLLVSPFTTGRNRSRKHFNGEKLKIYADSGGFQTVTMNKRVASLNVLRWQQRIAHTAFTSDIPPHHFSKNYTKDQFLKCMYQSNKNANLMWEFNKDYDMQLYGVIQGRTYNELKMWYEDLTKDHDYDGYCISLSNNKSDTDLYWLEQLHFASTIPKRIHFLGKSDRLFNAVLSIFAQKQNQCYTFDSSSSNIGGRFGKYIHPITETHLSLSKYESQRDNIESLPCNCPICSKHSLDDLINTTELINLHNLYVKISFCKFANIVSTDDELFKIILKKVIPRNKHRKTIETQVQKLLGLGSMSSSYENSEAIAKIQVKIDESKDLTDFDKEFLKWFTVKFMDLKV
ncbi:MAG: hypothetical protein KAJ44_01065 [Thermoplasmatales archaeon]|nr:hypothetical protein [Thermoplasmatales archaeon]